MPLIIITTILMLYISSVIFLTETMTVVNEIILMI